MVRTFRNSVGYLKSSSLMPGEDSNKESQLKYVLKSSNGMKT